MIVFVIQQNDGVVAVRESLEEASNHIALCQAHDRQFDWPSDKYEIVEYDTKPNLEHVLGANMK